MPIAHSIHCATDRELLARITRRTEIAFTTLTVPNCADAPTLLSLDPMLGFAGGTKVVSYGIFFFAVIAGIPRTMTAGTIATLTYIEYFDNQTDGYYGPFPSIPTTPPLGIPLGASVTWTATVDVSTQPPFPNWTLSSSNLPASLTALLEPISIFWFGADAIRGIAPGGFTWQGQDYLGAYTIQFPNCPVSSSCTATTLGQYYLPGYFTYASTTFDTLSISTTPEPNTLFSLSLGLAVLFCVRVRRKRRSLCERTARDSAVPDCP